MGPGFSKLCLHQASAGQAKKKELKGGIGAQDPCRRPGGGNGHSRKTDANRSFVEPPQGSSPGTNPEMSRKKDEVRSDVR